MVAAPSVNARVRFQLGAGSGGSNEHGERLRSFLVGGLPRPEVVGRIGPQAPAVSPDVGDGLLDAVVPTEVSVRRTTVNQPNTNSAGRTAATKVGKASLCAMKPMATRELDSENT